MEEFPFLPEHASTFAWQVDALYLVLIGLSALFIIPIVLLIVFFSIRYRRNANVDREMSHTSNRLEWGAVGVLFSMVLPIFLWSAFLFYDMSRPPPGALEITVVARQWMWKFQHPTGQSEINELHVPLGQPVRLTMISEDVIHSLYVPAFRAKHDVLPGRYTTMWFQATKAGTYHLFCTEYCGTEHSGMIGQVVVLEQADYQAWLSTGGRQGGGAGGDGGAAQTPQEAGQALFGNLGCVSCHRAGGVGPALEGVFGAQVALQDGTTVTADEAYMRQSILEPASQVVQGYNPVMPSFQGQVTEEQLMQLIAYVRSLGAQAAPAP